MGMILLILPTTSRILVAVQHGCFWFYFQK